MYAQQGTGEETYLGIVTGNPRVFEGHPYPYPPNTRTRTEGTGFCGLGSRVLHHQIVGDLMRHCEVISTNLSCYMRHNLAAASC
jgi:hypothetical protein